METGVILIQEPVSAKTQSSVEEASAGVILDHLSMEIVEKVIVSTVIDDEITSPDFTNNIIAEVVNGSGDKEIEESEGEKGEATKTILVKEKASEKEKDEQGSFSVHEPESFNTNTEDAKMISNDVTLKKEKDDGITQKSEEVIFEKSVIEEDQTDTKHAAEQEKEINNIPTALVDNASVKFDEDHTEKSLHSPREKIPKDETDEVKDLRSVAVNETEAESNAMVPDKEISRNIVNEIASEDDRQGEKAEAIKYIDDAEKISHKVTGDREKEEDITRKVEEVQESPLVIETPTVQGEKVESKDSKDTEELEHVLMPQIETLITEAESVKTSTVHVSVEQPVREEVHAEAKPSAEQVGEIGTISQVLSDTALVKSNEDAIEKSSSNSAREEILIKTEEVKEEEDSRTVESSVNGSASEHKATFPVEEMSTDSENIVKVTAPEKETATLHDVETTERVLDANETETVQKVIEDPEIVNDEKRTIHETERLKENAEKISHGEAVDRAKEEDVTTKTEEVRESPREIETPTIQAEDIESKNTLDNKEEVDKSSEETKEDENVLVSAIPHGETLISEAETVGIFKTLETKEDTETNLNLKEDKGEEEPETVKTISAPDGVRSSHVEAEEFGEPCSSEIKEESVEDTFQDEITAEKLLDVPSKEPEAALVANSEEELEKCEEIPLEKEELKDDKTQTMEKEESGEPEAEKIKMDETEESPVEKLVALPAVESVEQKQKPSSIELPCEVSEETRKTEDEKMEEKLKEEVTPHREGEEEEGSYVIESKKETGSVPKSSELEERSVTDLTPLQEKETTDEVSSASPSAELEGETDIGAEANGEEQAADKILKNLDTVETFAPHSSFPSSSEEHGNVSKTLEGEQVKEDDATTVVEMEQTRDIGPSLPEKCSVDRTEAEDEQEKVTPTEKGETRINESEDEHVDFPTSLMCSEKNDMKTLTAKEKKGDEETTVSDIPQDETIVTEVAVDTCTIQEAAILKTSETTIIDPEAVHIPIGSVEKSQETKEDTVASLDLKEQEETKTINTVILSDEVKTSDVKAEEFDEGQGREENVEAKPKEIVQDESTQEKNENLLDELSEETSKTADVNIEEKPTNEVTTNQVSQEEGPCGLETKDETVSALESREVGEKSLEEELCPPNEQEEEMKLRIEQIERHEPKTEEVSNDQQNPAEEKSDEISRVSSASPSENWEGETIVEGEKIEEITTNEAEKVADKNQKSLETVEIAEPHSSLPSSSEKQEHDTVAEAEKTEDKKVKEAEPTGEVSEKSLEIAESLPSVGQEKEIQVPSVALSLHEQEKFTSSEKANESEDGNLDEHVNSPTLPMISQTNDNETLIAEAKKGDEEITSSLDGSGTSQTSENVCMKQDEFDNLEAPKLEESKEDMSREISETTEASGDQNSLTETPSSDLISEQNDQSPKLVQEIHETSREDHEQIDQITKGVEEIHEEESKETSKLEAEEILPAEIIPRESSSEEVPVSMLTTKEDDQVIMPEGNCAGDTTEIKDTQEVPLVCTEQTKPKESVDVTGNEHVDSPTSSMFSKKDDNDSLTAEAKKGDEATDKVETSKNVREKEEFVNLEAPKLEEYKEDKRQEIPKTTEAVEATSDQSLPNETSETGQTLASELVSGLDDQATRKVDDKFEAPGDQSLPVETFQEDQTPSSDLASELDNQIPKQVEEIYEEETKEAHKLQVGGDQILPVETLQADQTTSFVTELEDKIPKQVEEIYKEETKEPHNLQDAANQILTVETSQAEQTPSLVSEQDDQTSKQAAELHEEETKEAQKLQAEEILTKTVPRESFSVAPDEPVTLQEGSCGGETQDDRHVSVDTEDKVGETKPEESKAEETQKSNDQVEASTKVTKEEDENINKRVIEVADLKNGQSISVTPENACLKHEEELKNIGKLQHGATTEDSPTGEAEHEDETSSTLPVIEILRGLQTELEAEREISDPASSGEIMITEPTEKVSDVEVVSNENDSAAEIIDANKLQQDESGDNSLAGKSLPLEEVQDVINKEFEVSVKERLHEEETREIAGKQEEHETQEDVYASTSDIISIQAGNSRDLEISKRDGDSSDQCMESELPADQPHNEQKTEIHEIAKEEDQIVNIKEVKKSEEVQDGKLGGLSATRDTEETFSSEVKKDQENANERGVGHDFSSAQVEKEEEPHSLLGNDEEIKDILTSDKQTTDPVEVLKNAEHESYEEQVQPQAISDDTKANNNKDFPTEQAPKDQREEPDADRSLTKEALDEQIQVLSSAIVDDQDLSVKKPTAVVQETLFEVKKEKENVDTLMPKKSGQVQDEPMKFEACVKDKDTSEQEQKSDDLTYVKLEVKDGEIRGEGHDSVVSRKEETSLVEEKREVEYVRTELENAIKHGVSVEEKNNASEKIGGKASEEICQEEGNVITYKNVQVQDEPNNFEAPAKDKETSEQEPKSKDLTYIQEDIGTNVKLEVCDETIKSDGHDSVVAEKDDPGLVEEKRDTKLEDAIKHGVSIEEKNSASEKIDGEASKEICQEESKQTAIKEETNEDELSGTSKEIPAENKMEETKKETTQECFDTDDDATQKTTPEIQETGNLSSVSDIQDRSKFEKQEREEQKQEGMPNQQKREIADEVPKLETLKVAEEPGNTKDFFSQVKDSEPTVKEPARKSLSDLIQIVKETNKTEDTTTKHHIEKEEGDEDGDEHKDDKTSPDSIVMVEAKDTVHVIKTHHKKSHGILSGVGSKVKHSISKVKKALTGKSSHTTKPSSPQ